IDAACACAAHWLACTGEHAFRHPGDQHDALEDEMTDDHPVGIEAVEHVQRRADDRTGTPASESATKQDVRAPVADAREQQNRSVGRRQRIPCEREPLGNGIVEGLRVGEQRYSAAERRRKPRYRRRAVQLEPIPSREQHGKHVLIIVAQAALSIRIEASEDEMVEKQRDRECEGRSEWRPSSRQLYSFRLLPALGRRRSAMYDPKSTWCTMP